MWVAPAVLFSFRPLGYLYCLHAASERAVSMTDAGSFTRKGGGPLVKCPCSLRLLFFVFSFSSSFSHWERYLGRLSPFLPPSLSLSFLLFLLSLFPSPNCIVLANQKHSFSHHDEWDDGWVGSGNVQRCVCFFSLYDDQSL